jgi:serine/threonine-protein kinase
MSKSRGESPATAAGQRFGNYIIGDRLAAGGMAELYRTRSIERRFEKPLALKRMLPHLAQNPPFVEMFIDEARISTQLSHPNIVEVYDFEATDRGLCLVMELVDGPDLLAVLKRCAKEGTQLPPELAVYIACHVLEALDYAHSVASNGRLLGVVHRDVSPSNILLTRRGHVKLADFGIARATERQHETAAGTLKGKYGYMSPEQVLGLDLDGRSDVFSLAIVLAETLMSRRLFAAPSDLDLLLMVRRADLSRLDKYGADIPPALMTVLRKALSHDRADRYPTAGALRDALADWLSAVGRRTGAGQLAAFIHELEQQGGDLCTWRVSTGGETPTTMSGPETRLARIELSKAVRAGREVFASGQARESSPTLEDGPELGRYDGGTAKPGSEAPVERRALAGVLALSEGLLEQVHPIELLCEIHRRRLTGRLVLQAETNVKEAYFVDGNPEFVRSNVGEDRFGQFLVRRGLLTAEQLGRVLAALPQFDGRMGQALVSLELLKPVDAVQLLAEQVAEKLTHAFGWYHGHYTFTPDARNPWPALALRLDTARIIGRGLEAIPAEILVDWELGHQQARPLIDRARAAAFGFEPALDAALAGFDGAHTLLEVVETVRAVPGRRRIVAAAYVAWRAGVLRLHPAETIIRSPGPEIWSEDLTALAVPESKAPVPRYQGDERRQHDRFEVCGTGVMQVCPSSRRGGEPSAMSATIFSATCDGVGISVAANEGDELPDRGEDVIVRFFNGREQLEMRGRIIWRSRLRPGEMAFGVVLQLPLCGARMRTAYGRWLEALLRRQRG